MRESRNPIRLRFRKMRATGRRSGFRPPRAKYRETGTGVQLHVRHAATLFAVAGVLSALTGCGPSAPLAASSRPDQPGADSVAAPSFAQFSDIPVPAGADMDLERSLVLGDRDSWIGRLVMTVPGSAGKAYDFYVSEMPKFGWVPVTMVRGETSVLTYSHGERIATVQIRDRTIAGAAISLTVSPRGKPALQGGPESPPAFDSRGGVRTTPIR